MKMKIYFLLSFSSVLLFVLMMGCATQERVHTYQKSTLGNHVLEDTRVKEYVSPDNKRVVKKQVIREKIRCVGPDGKTIPVNSRGECLKKEAHVVEEVYQEDKIIKRNNP